MSAILANIIMVWIMPLSGKVEDTITAGSDLIDSKSWAGVFRYPSPSGNRRVSAGIKCMPISLARESAISRQDEPLMTGI